MYHMAKEFKSGVMVSDRFEGTWINGKQEGYGIMHYLKSNSKYKQLFKNGNYVSGERIK